MDFYRYRRYRSYWWVNSLLIGFIFFLIGSSALGELHNEHRIHMLALNGWKTQGVITRKFIKTEMGKHRLVHFYYYRYAFLANNCRIAATHELFDRSDYD